MLNSFKNLADSDNQIGMIGPKLLNDDGTFSYDHDCSDDPDETFFTYFVTDGEDTTQVADTALINIQNEFHFHFLTLYSILLTFKFGLTCNIVIKYVSCSSRL